jgi:hypothetical protein
MNVSHAGVFVFAIILLLLWGRAALASAMSRQKMQQAATGGPLTIGPSFPPKTPSQRGRSADATPS